MTERECWLWLNNVPYMWHNKIKKLLEAFGTPLEIYNSSKERLVLSKAVSEKDIYHITHSKEIIDPVKIAEDMDKNNIKFVTIDEEKYPGRLKLIDNPPYCLYVKGKLPDKGKAVSVVGARNCSDYGRNMARAIGRKLAELGLDVISGMARGIDTYGHIGALEGKGYTYAVLGSGVDVCYPSENAELYEEIVKRGGVISEFPMGAKPEGWRFPQRNRIISGLSHCVIVVEAKVKSGSLITAELALEQGADVMAVPGRAGDKLSEGSNMLIKDGAEIITCLDDIGNFLGMADVKNNENLIKLLEKDFEVVYSETDLSPVSIDELAERTGMKIEKLYEILLKLQLRNLIWEPVKNYYARKL